jgi:hypothetical protein
MIIVHTYSGAVNIFMSPTSKVIPIFGKAFEAFAKGAANIILCPTFLRPDEASILRQTPLLIFFDFFSIQKHACQAEKL